jgi:hypothetical protein
VKKKKLTTNLNMKKVCGRVVPQSSPIFNQKKYQRWNTLRAHKILSHVTFFVFQKLKNSLKGNHLHSTEDIHKKMTQLFKALSQNGFRRCFEVWKVVCRFQWKLLWRG